MNNNIVISGMACRFPESESYQKLWENLLSKKDMLSADDRRWPVGSFGIPERFGKINSIERFDAAFFGVHGKQADKMDPQLRLLLETSYEAFIDAGIDPVDIKGSDTGVFIGACFSDMMAIAGNNIESITGYENSGCSLSMFANRLSFYYDFHGPSHTVDTACSSSIVALDAAISALNEGKCEYAVVGGSSMILNPSVSLGFSKLKMLSPGSRCKSFDQFGDGYARAEGVGVVILTKAALAKRVRARIHGSALNSDGYTDKGITFPNGLAQQKLLTDLYRRCAINPQAVSYIEAHGTGTAAGDPQEVNAIEQALDVSLRDSDSPLYIGSIKSNMGHAEGAAGMAGLIKVLLCMEHGMIPANLHYSTPNENIQSLVKGTIKVVDEHMQWDGGIVGINSFGFGGTNAHVILEGGIKQHTGRKLSSDRYIADEVVLPVIPCAARTLQAVDRLLGLYNETDISQQAAGFIQNISNRSTDLFQYRACLVCNSTEKHVQNSFVKGKVVANPAEIWFVYPGMGSQWNGMGQGLMSHPVFAETIRALDNALEETEIDLRQLLAKSEDDQFITPCKTFVAITAIQLALTDMVCAYGISPSGIVGHSVGEIACAYADGAISREQAIQVAYYRGLSVQQTQKVKGKMLVAQLTWEAAQAHCIEGVVAACHNSEYSVTYSGEEAAINTLGELLGSQGVDIQRVNSIGIAFHSHLIKSAAPVLNEYLSNIITQPASRSNRWISSSHAQGADASTCSAEYFVNNLLNPVLFHDALKHIPDNAIVIELGPHSLMRASLMESVNSITYINMMRRDFNCLDTFKNAMAQMYVGGINVDWTAKLYQPCAITSQVSIPELTGWDHSTSWKIPDFDTDILRSNADHIYNIDLKGDEYGYFKDHQINQHIVVPGMAYLYMVWQAMAKISRTKISQLKISFSDVRFHRATIIKAHCAIDLKVRYLATTQKFEVVERDDLVVSGQVVSGDEIKLPEISASSLLMAEAEKANAVYMESDDIYKELRLRGYNYGPAFRGIKRVSTDGCYVDINWENNWVTFLDCMLHSNVVRHERKTLVPTYIRSMTIDPLLQAESEQIEIYSEKYIQRLNSKAVVMEDCEFGVMPSANKHEKAVLSSMEFVPFDESGCFEQSPDCAPLEYIQLVHSYILTQLEMFFVNIRNNNINLPAHIEKLQEVVSSCSYEPYTDAILSKYARHPDAILLRLAMHVYSQPEKFLEDAMPVIVSFDEYNDLYKNDIAAAFLFSNRYLGSMIQIVLENMGSSRSVNFGEVGAGTGGVTSHILPFLRSSEDTYKITDISGGFFEKLKEEFSSYSAVTEYASWDIAKPAPANMAHSMDLITASNVIHASKNIRQALGNIHESLREGGFLLLHETTHGDLLTLGIWGFIEDIWDYEDGHDRSHGAFVSKERWIELLDECGFDLISSKDDGLLSTLYLCRKRAVEKLTNTIIDIDEIDLSLRAIQDGLKIVSENEKSRLWLNGDSLSVPGLCGMVNCIRKEGDENRIRSIYKESEEPINEAALSQIMKYDLVLSVYRDSQWGSFRYLDMPKNELSLSGNAHVNVASVGDLSSLGWMSSPDGSNAEDTYDAYYCAINFKDVMLATGKLSASAFGGTLASSMTGEFSGVSPNGRRVMGFINRPFSTKIQISEQVSSYVWDIPDKWSLEQAATVPVVYMTAYLALIVRANIQSGQRVLIHSGTGGVGQAAIRIAQSRGCEIFATVGSRAKQELLQSIFPEIDDRHIYSSRTTAFESEIMNVTQGKGVQVILNSLADDKLQASLRVLSRYGQFLEIGKYDMTKNTPLGMQVYLRDVRISGVGLDNVMNDDMDSIEAISDLMKEGVAAGVVQPLQRTVFNHDQLEEAFRFMAAGKHTGKVLLKIREQGTEVDACVSAMPKFWCDANKTYLVTGGLGGFGFELIHWLIERGARHIMLTSRSGVKNGYQTYWLNKWQEQGVSVDISHLDVGSKEQAGRLMAQLKKPLGGIFHLAMILEDAFLMNQTAESFKRVVNIKYDACRYLDELSRELAPELDCFVMFSSLSGGAGNRGQSNYGYANFAMDRLCETRKQQGFHALSIQWGVVGDVGFVNENKEYVDTQSLFSEAQSLSSCLQTLDGYLLQDKPVVSSYVRYCNIFKQSNSANDSLPGELGTEETLVQYIKNILGIPRETQVSDDIKFSTLGMDSLMVVEIKRKLEIDYAILLTLPEIQQLSFAALKTLFNNKHKEHADSTPDSGPDNKATELSYQTTFELFSGQSNATNVVYFLNGFATDPVVALSDLVMPSNARIYIVRYEQARNMDKLATLWEQHMLEHTVSTDNIHIVGFSIGATIIHRFKQLIDFSKISANIKSTVISTPAEQMFEPLSALSVGEINALSDDEAISQISNLPWFKSYNSTSHKVIIDQVKFIVADHFYSKALSEVEKIILPADDELCWTVTKAKTMSSNVEQVEGEHDLKSVVLQDIMFGQASGHLY